MNFDQRSGWCSTRSWHVPGLLSQATVIRLFNLCPGDSELNAQNKALNALLWYILLSIITGSMHISYEFELKYSPSLVIMRSALRNANFDPFHLSFATQTIF